MNSVIHKTLSIYTCEEVKSFFLFNCFIQWQNSAWTERLALGTFKKCCKYINNWRCQKGLGLGLGWVFFHFWVGFFEVAQKQLFETTLSSL